MSETAGIYLSIPFCKAKCSFCNFASDVFAEDRWRGYVDRLCAEIRGARGVAERMGAVLPEAVDSVYFGGGTPSLLEPEFFREIFACLRGEFAVADDAEMTVEGAPGQLTDTTLEELLRQGVNRFSFGVQSFVDRESAAVGRLHTGRECREEFLRMQRAGAERLSLDLIAGLPHQTEASWLHSVEEAVASGVEHVSVYMLEVDDGSRLGREALAGGGRYHAPDLPEDDAVAEWYLAACERLEAAGIRQYEISNFARVDGESRHNLKYWQRRPYVGFGLDAHSMLRTGDGGVVRWANVSEMDAYVARRVDGLGARFVPDVKPEVERIGVDGCFEEAVFLGLRLNRGINLEGLSAVYGDARVDGLMDGLRDTEEAGLVERVGARVRLTARGRTASNEVFSRLLVDAVV